MGTTPTEAEARPLQIPVGLLISNGPGSIRRSARKVRVRRAANAVASSDQQGHGRMPQHCGYSHGGNTYEGMAFILEQFKDVTLASPTDGCAFCVPWPTRMIGSR